MAHGKTQHPATVSWSRIFLYMTAFVKRAGRKNFAESETYGVRSANVCKHGPNPVRPQAALSARQTTFPFCEKLGSGPS